jgi:hypothetical protein
MPAVAAAPKTKEKAKGPERPPSAEDDWDDLRGPWPAAQPAGAAWDTGPRQPPARPEASGQATAPGTQQVRYGNAEVARVATETHPSELEAQQAARGVLPEAGVTAQAPSLGGPPPADVQAVLRRPGQPLDGATRERMEGAIGESFEDVRVHHDSQAARSAEGLGARAYAAGRDVVFAEDQYRPATTEGDEVLRHELAHVVQHGRGRSDTDARPDAISRFPFGPFTPRTWAPPGVTGPSGPTLPPRVVINATDPVELRGRPKLDPSPEVRKKIQDAGGKILWLAVKYGSIAKGSIPIFWTATGLQTPDPQPHYGGYVIPLGHPAFQRLPSATPVVWMNVKDDVVAGGIGWETPLWVKLNDRFWAQNPFEKLFGLTGFKNVVVPETINELSGGLLKFEIPVMSFDYGDDFQGTAQLAFHDQSFKLDGGIDVPVTGLPAASRVPIKSETNSALTLIYGTYGWSFGRTLAGGAKISGRLVATLGDGLLDIEGTASYSQSKPEVSGTVTVLITSFEKAKQRVKERLGPDAPADIKPGGPGEKLAVAGWGQLDFSFTEWLTGNAEVILHPEGYITARGEIVPTKIVPLFKKKAEEKELFPAKSASMPLVFIPLWGDVSAEATVGPLKAYGSFGAGTLHDLRVSGLISNHPGIVNRFELAGIVSAPATAGLTLEAGGKISAKLVHMVEILSAGVTVKGDLRLDMLAHAGIQAGRRAGPKGTPEYYVEGDVAATAELVLDLHIWFGGSVLVWRGHIKAVERTFSLGNVGVGLHFVAALDKEGESRVEADFSKVKFDRDKFLEAVVRSETVEKRGYTGKSKVESGTEGEIQPDAPIPPDAPRDEEKSRAIVRVLRKDFTMLTEPHQLILRLQKPPLLEMSTDLPAKPVRKRLAGARAHLKKETLRPEKTEAQLAELDKMEAVTRQVEQEAAKAAVAPVDTDPHVPALEPLGDLMHGYGDRFYETDLVSGLSGSPPTVPPPTPAAPPKSPAAQLARAREKFKKEHWVRRQLEELLDIGETTAKDRIRGWREARQLFALETSATDPLKAYNFDETRAGERPLKDTESNRARYGFKNPAHDSPQGQKILAKGLRPDSPKPTSDPASTYDSMRGGTRAVAPSKYVDFTRPLARLGHGPVGASAFWNDGKPKPGHQQSFEENRKWNLDPGNYWGPEHKDESDASGGSSPRYKVPMREIGSHEDWL